MASISKLPLVVSNRALKVSGACFFTHLSLKTLLLLQAKAIKITERKFYKYLYLRLIRQRGTASNLALSVAIGVFFGFVVPLFQMLLAVVAAWALKTNKIVAVACTWISNPLTGILSQALWIAGNPMPRRGIPNQNSLTSYQYLPWTS